MRKRYLISVLLFCLLATCAAGCSPSAGSDDTPDGDGQTQDTQSTTTLPRTTTTLATATWEKLAPEGDLPVARLGGSLVYIPTGDQLLLFGGWDGGSEYLNDLWSYDVAASLWSRLEIEGEAPPARASQAAAYDPVSDKLIMFGGYDGGTYYGDAWAYDLAGQTWTALASAGGSPSPRYGHSLVYDPESKKMILFGGYGGTVQYGDTWAYDPATNVWTDLKPTGDTPAARDSQALVYDSDTKMMVLFGGWNTTTTFNDTWTYDPAANTWVDLEPAGGPPLARALHQMVYDSSIKKSVMFGGGNSSATFDDAWLFDLGENTWTKAAAEGDPPSARAGHSMVYDPSARAILVFGGSNGIDAYLHDLWRLSR